MSLLGRAAVVIWVELPRGLHAEHDAWHSYEHLPERMGIPGFLRGRRAAALDSAAPEQRFALYELEDIAVTTSPAYLERLNDPTPWSCKVQSQCRLSRTLCRVSASHGEGTGSELVTVRFSSTAGREHALRDALKLQVLAGQRGLVGVHLLERDAGTVRPLTNEERLRRGGVDAFAGWVLLIEAYDAEAALRTLDPATLAEFGGTTCAYRLSHIMKGMVA